MVDGVYALKQPYVQVWHTFLTCDLSRKCMGVQCTVSIMEEQSFVLNRDMPEEEKVSSCP